LPPFVRDGASIERSAIDRSLPPTGPSVSRLTGTGNVSAIERIVRLPKIDCRTVAAWLAPAHRSGRPAIVTTTMIPKQALLILLFATMTLSACGSIGYVGYVDPAPGKDACALLTTDEIEHATGRQLLSSRPYQHGEFPSSCTWTFASGSYDPTGPNPTWLGVDLSYRQRGDFDSYLAEEKKPSGEQSAAPSRVSAIKLSSYLFASAANCGRDGAAWCSSSSCAFPQRLHST